LYPVELEMSMEFGETELECLLMKCIEKYKKL